MSTPKSTTELLPCPFCGGPVQLEKTHKNRHEIYGERQWWGVRCTNTVNVGGTCAVEAIPTASPEAAIKRWNRRAPAMAPKQEADHINDVVEMVAPAGWKLVPIEPTIEMIAALGWGGDEVLAVGHGAISGGIADEYAAMLAAAPAAPAAANGAPELPPLPKSDVEGGYYDSESGFTKKAMQEYALTYGRAILAAAGPDAALAESDDALNDALQRACSELPEGYSIRVEVECGAGWVEWIGDDVAGAVDHEGSLAADVLQALADAKEHAAGGAA